MIKRDPAIQIMARLLTWRRLAAKYPGTEEASHAQLKIAETLERGLDRLEEALEEYRKATGRWAPEAQQAILRLTGTSMVRLSTLSAFARAPPVKVDHR